MRLPGIRFRFLVHPVVILFDFRSSRMLLMAPLAARLLSPALAQSTDYTQHVDVL